MKFPTTIGACADEIYEMRSRRLQLEREAAEIKEDESELTEHIFKLLDAAKLEKGGSKHVTLATTHTRVPVIEDYEAFAKYVVKTKQLDLLERRAAKGACVERWDAGKAIPGIGILDRKGLSITKVN